MVGCAGGGSNLGGLIAPYMAERLQGKSTTRFVAVEPASCPSLTEESMPMIFATRGASRRWPKCTPWAAISYLLPTTPVDLRYHGMSPVLSKLYHDGELEAISVVQTKAFDAAVLFAKTEQIFPAPESAHAIYGAIQEALKYKASGEAGTILFRSHRHRVL
jgi:tryptophan synthase beta chain